MTTAILVTGGCGFIGTALCLHLLNQPDIRIINVDALTYAANPLSLAHLRDHPRYRFVHADVREGERLADLMVEEAVDGVIHLAAESHVDRSIDAAAPFIETNISGTVALLEAARRYLDHADDTRRERFRLVHLSTDEVYGSLGETGVFREDSAYDPRSPYAASKAAADHLVAAWTATYGLPAIVVNATNNYGPRQFPEKLIPLAILNALEHRPIGVYGDGRNRRDWLHVEDHARALLTIFRRGRVGERYHVSAEAERENLDVVRAICAALDARLEHAPAGGHGALITLVPDRPGHDFRYALDGHRLRTGLGWEPGWDFESGLTATVDWYLENRAWWQPLREVVYDGGRLGRPAAAG